MLKFSKTEPRTILTKTKNKAQHNLSPSSLQSPNIIGLFKMGINWALKPEFNRTARKALLFQTKTNEALTFWETNLALTISFLLHRLSHLLYVITPL